MIIIVQCVITMTMLHTCAGLTDRPITTKVNRVSRVHKYVSTVEVLNTVHPTAAGDLGTKGNNHIVLYICYGKLYLHKQKFFSRNSISFKNIL